MITIHQYAVQGNIILGTRGAGKTTTAKFFAEQLMEANIPVVIIDPIGNWKHLREPNPSSSNGTGYPVILAGKGGDIEISSATVVDVMKTVMEERASIVFDLFDVDLLPQWDEIVTKIIKTLLYHNHLYGLRHIFIEEASEFVHQYGKKTNASVWIERLVRLSGNVKVGATFINQNPESISKSIVKLCDGRVIGRQTEKNSINMAKKWFQGGGVSNGAEISETLPGLGAGEFWVWSTGNDPVKVQIPNIRSNHPSRNDLSVTDLSPASPLGDVISKLTSIKKKSYAPIRVDVSSTYSGVGVDEKVSFVLPDIVPLNAYEVSVINMAQTASFGSSTVAEFINKAYTLGYIFWDGLYISTQEGNRVSLHSNIEKEYANIVYRNTN
jgi:hypothetical protein